MVELLSNQQLRVVGIVIRRDWGRNGGFHIIIFCVNHDFFVVYISCWSILVWAEKL